MKKIQTENLNSLKSYGFMNFSKISNFNRVSTPFFSCHLTFIVLKRAIEGNFQSNARCKNCFSVCYFLIRDYSLHYVNELFKALSNALARRFHLDWLKFITHCCMKNFFPYSKKSCCMPDDVCVCQGFYGFSRACTLFHLHFNHI